MKAKNSQSQQILNSSLSSLMWKLSLPAIAAMVLFGLNAFLDAIFVGQLVGETALAGVALAYPLSNLMMGFGSWIGTGAGNVLSIAIGANDEETQKRLLGTVSFLTLTFSIIFTIVAWFSAPYLIQAMGGTGEILDIGTRYFRVSILGTIFWIYALSLNMVIRGEGKMMEAAKMMATGLIVNIILNPIFISVLGMGVEGAAIATIIGMMVYSIRGYLYFRNGKASFEADIHKFSRDKSTARMILKTGLPGFILTVMSLVQSFVVFNALTNVGDEDDVAFFAAANRILLFMMTPLFGLMRSLQPVIGINFGAGQYDRVKAGFRLFTKGGFFIVAPFWLLMSLFPEPTLRLMLPDLQFTDEHLNYFRIYILILPLLPFVFNSLTYFPAIGQPRRATFITMARQVIFYVPVMLILPGIFGIPGIYIGGTAIDLVVTGWMAWAVITSMNRLQQLKPDVQV